MFNIRNLICGLLILSTYALDSSSTDLQNITTKVSPQRLAEGGSLPEDTEDKTHLSREHVIDTAKTTLLTTSKSLNTSQSMNETNSKILNNGKVKPVIDSTAEIDAGVSKKNDEKQSVGKKGVSLNETDNTVPLDVVKNTTSTLVIKPKASTTKAPIPKKPLITEHDDFVSNDAESTKIDTNPKIPSIDTLLEKKSQRANYVIPIVAVILSVPLVTIIISFLYKRGTDWWQHRNYRRMDFLIEGMYNN